MLKRLLWLTIGLSIGFGTSYWTVRYVRRTLERLTPERLVDGAGRMARGLTSEIKAAAGEGREAMRRREAELWAELQRKRP